VARLVAARGDLEAHADEVDAAGYRLVVGNGGARPRVVTTGAGRSRCAPRESTTVGRRAGSPPPSCRPTCARPRRSSRCSLSSPGGDSSLRGLSTGDFA
jgi:hypothetical protein